MQLGRFGRSFIRLKGFRQQNYISMTICILNKLHATQKWNEKKAFDWVKKKVKSKWDEFQTQAQQMQKVQRPMLVHLTFDMLGIIGIPAWGGGGGGGVNIKKCTGVTLKKFKQAKFAYAKPFKVAWGVRN